MDWKKVIIAVIIVLIIVVGGFYVLKMTAPQTIKYDEHFNVSVPADFKTSKVNGSVKSTFPANQSYTLELSEDGNTEESIENQYKLLNDLSNITEVKTVTDIKKYNVGKNKVYEYTTTDANAIKDLNVNAKKVRDLAIIVPNSSKVYGMTFATNDTSLNLNNTDIEAIINSTSQT